MKAGNRASGSVPVTWRGLALVSVLLGSPFLKAAQTSAADKPSLPGEQVFALREVSAFEEGGQDFTRGQSGECRDQPYEQVKGYPRFTSKKPVYGVVRFELNYQQPDSGTPCYFAIDESQGTGKGYDTLYFDVNRDRDLRDNSIIRPLRNAPAGASLQYGGIKEQVLFEYVSIPFEFGGAGKRPVEIMPRLLRTSYGQETHNQVLFVRTRIFAGPVKIGTREFGARLGNQYVIMGRLDQPHTCLILTPSEGGSFASWWGGDSLSAAHKVDGVFYTFAASTTGDKLTVRRYAGDLGVFELGPGNRALDTLSFRGAFRGKELSVPAGGEIVSGWPSETNSCQVPVGDYLPACLNVEFGRLKLFLSDNYHSDGKPRERGGKAPVHGIKIRKDKPFVLDFSAKPQVLFASPAKDQRLKRGDTLEVKAVLVDPELDIMIRGLDDTRRKQKTTADGRPLTYERNLSLDPTVIVRRTGGKKIAQGVMPFG